MKTMKIYRVSTNGNFGGNADKAPFTTKEKAEEFVGKMILDFGIEFECVEGKDFIHYVSKEVCRITTPHHTEEGVHGYAEIWITEDTLNFLDDEQFIPNTLEDYTYRPEPRNTKLPVDTREQILKSVTPTL